MQDASARAQGRDPDPGKRLEERLARLFPTPGNPLEHAALELEDQQLGAPLRFFARQVLPASAVTDQYGDIAPLAFTALRNEIRCQQLVHEERQSSVVLPRIEQPFEPASYIRFGMVSQLGETSVGSGCSIPDLRHQFTQDRILAREVSVEGRARDSGSAYEITDGRVSVSRCEEQLAGRCKQALVGAFDPGGTRGASFACHVVGLVLHRGAVLEVGTQDALRQPAWALHRKEMRALRELLVMPVG